MINDTRKDLNGHKIINQNALHFLTFTVVGWVDVFTRKAYRDAIIDSLVYCQQEKGLRLFAYVIMSNHIHMIARTDEGIQLSDVVRDFKKLTAKKIIEKIVEDSGESRQEWMLRIFKYHAKYNSDNTLYQFWRKGNHPVELASPNWINEKMSYIHYNPVRAGIVRQAVDYLYSSASNYLGESGLLDVEIINIGATEGYIEV